MKKNIRANAESTRDNSLPVLQKRGSLFLRCASFIGNTLYIVKKNYLRRKSKKNKIMYTVGKLTTYTRFNTICILIVAMLAFFGNYTLFADTIQKNLPKNDEQQYKQPLVVVRSDTMDVDAYIRNYFEFKKPKKVMMISATAYSSTPSQTDDSPHKTAYNTFVRDGIVAANFLPVGTVVKFPKKFGDKFFVVEDRMNERYSLHVDIWMADKEEAEKFGVQYLEMEIF